MTGGMNGGKTREPALDADPAHGISVHEGRR
jgi:hypothetical protein